MAVRARCCGMVSTRGETTLAQAMLKLLWRAALCAPHRRRACTRTTHRWLCLVHRRRALRTVELPEADPATTVVADVSLGPLPTHTGMAYLASSNMCDTSMGPSWPAGLCTQRTSRRLDAWPRMPGWSRSGAPVAMPRRPCILCTLRCHAAEGSQSISP